MDRGLDTRRGQKDDRADTRISRPAHGRYEQGTEMCLLGVPAYKGHPMVWRKFMLSKMTKIESVSLILAFGQFPMRRHC